MEHSGQIYDERQDGEASVEWVSDRSGGHGKVDYRYLLTGAHEGPLIEIWMKGAGFEYDEYGANVCWDSLVWADDETNFDDDYLLDAYSDALTADLQELTRRVGY